MQSPLRMALSPGNFSCGEDGDIYCRNCYSTKYFDHIATMNNEIVDLIENGTSTKITSFGVRGRAGSIGRALTASPTNFDDPNMCPRYLTTKSQICEK